MTKQGLEFYNHPKSVPVRLSQEKSSCISLCLCKYTHVFVYASVDVHFMCVYICVEARGQPQVFFLEWSTFFLWARISQGDLVLIDCARMTCQGATGICLSLPRQYWDHKCESPCLFFQGFWEWDSVFMMCVRYFTELYPQPGNLNLRWLYYTICQRLTILHTFHVSKTDWLLPASYIRWDKQILPCLNVYVSYVKLHLLVDKTTHPVFMCMCITHICI